ncbi:hypothetical protein EC973_007414 [Apophysomyces ossiformis]|uniref:Alpha/beta hydrolase fold-3 domain-containing protein n=1 Tax=Apophysomyces ossiformis TaxID=679940 RepID=A0A8H7BPB0_9FUNG|nr:hypothetical protein EC973_007414 [Apophysomyces ossiformis]
MWIDVMYYLSYIKLGAWLNFRRKSTVGWSIYNILLDFTGGSLSIAQLLLDAYLSGDWSGVSGDPVKFGLGFVSIAFDLIFMAQHYLLYPDRTDFYLNSVEEERRRLIVEGRVPRHDVEEEESGTLVKFLGALFFKYNDSWTQSSDRGIWIAEDIKQAKREELEDRLSSSDVVLFWIPGGGFRFHLTRLYIQTFIAWIRALEADKNLKCMVFVPQYRLSPEHPFPAAIQDITSTYDWLLKTMHVSPKKILWGGDDAGVAVALDTLQRLEKEQPRPVGLICASPYIGYEAGGESWRDNMKNDFILASSITRMEESYIPEEGEQPFQYIPSSFDLATFLPRHMLIFVGGKEVLLDEAGRLEARARSGGVQVTMIQQPDEPHLWSMLGGVTIRDPHVWQNSIDRWAYFVANTIKTP